MPRASRSGKWVFTYFFDSVDDNDEQFDDDYVDPIQFVLDQIQKVECKWLIYQTEKCPHTGRLHVQGALTLPTPLAMKAVKLLFNLSRLHLESMAGSPMQSRIYCTKTESRAEPPNYHYFEKGVPPKQQGTRTDMKYVLRDSLQLTEVEMFELYPQIMVQYGRRILHYRQIKLPHQSERPVVTVYWGPTGCGKSWRCRENAKIGSQEDYCAIPTPVSRVTPAWTDGYLGQEDVVIEDFSGGMHYQTLLRMLDEYPLQTPTKGGFTRWIPKRIWINSNLHPKDWYPEMLWDDSNALRRRLTDSTSKIIHCTTRLDKFF